MRKAYFGAYRKLVFALAVAGAGIALSGTARGENPPVCDAKSLKGTFGYRFSGFAYDNFGNMYLLAAVGRVTADGEGNLSGAESYSFDGSIVRRPYTGTYTMNEDCTGTVTLTPTGSGLVHADIVVVNKGLEAEWLQTDSGYVVSGTLKRQTAPAVEAASVQGQVQAR